MHCPRQSHSKCSAADRFATNPQPLWHRYVLEQILSGEATETVVENIHEYLTTVGTDVRAGKMKLDEFIIYKVS